jgi:clan AA aspartic protease (TIGR02281 family)
VFLANLRKLEELEGDILVEDIPLRREGNTYWANLKINGENTLDMVVDSGANTILLSFEDAGKVGLKPGDKDPLVRLSVADGRMTTGRVMTIKSMQLGQFTADNVECVVLNAEAGRAAPLLGMTFLGRFKFQLDGGKSTLSLTKVREASATMERSNRSNKLPPFQLLRSDWQVVPAVTHTQYWQDREYAITEIPDQLKGASLIRRKIDDPDWLSGEIIAHQPLDLFVAMRADWVKNKRLQHDVDEAALTKLKSEGWKQIEGFSAAALPQQRWTWALLHKRIDPGPISISNLISMAEPRVLIFVRPATP